MEPALPYRSARSRCRMRISPRARCRRCTSATGSRSARCARISGRGSDNGPGNVLETKKPRSVALSRFFAHARNTEKPCLVPTARLELAQLSPLPPQDSVSTNFTTSALQGRNSSVTLRVCEGGMTKSCPGARSIPVEFVRSTPIILATTATRFLP
ncbi:hypothetical protein EMIT0158MI4_20280 [Burkholderia ambifaria]